MAACLENDGGRTEPRRGEAPGAGDEASGGLRDDVATAQGEAPSQRDVEARAALAASFNPSIFPAHRDRLVAEAETNFADGILVGALRQLPDAVYESPGQLWSALRDHGVGGAGP